MASKLFYELNRDSDSDRSDVSAGTVNGEIVTDSLVFDKNRNSVWAQGHEYGVPTVCSADYIEEDTFLQSVTDDTDTSRHAQVFIGAGGTEYTLYVTPSGALNIYGFNPISINALQSGYGGTSFVKNNTLSVEIGTDITTLLTTVMFSLGGSSVTQKTIKSCTLTTSNPSVFNGLDKVFSITEIGSITQTNYLNIEPNNGINALDPGTVSLKLTVIDSKDNKAESSIDMLTIYDKCYYFFSPLINESTYTQASPMSYSTLSSMPGFKSWQTASLESHTITGADFSTIDKLFYVAVPAAYTAVLKQIGFPVEWDAPSTMYFTNGAGATRAYKVYHTREFFWGGSQNVSIDVSK